MLAPGSTLHRYRVDGVIGEGGMGSVYRAFDTQLERVVAIKVLRAESLPPAERTARIARLRAEARAVAQLNHPNVVAIFDVGENDGAPYLVMEFVPGRSLRQLVARAEIDLAERTRWIVDVGMALEAAHGVGLVHRDVKPENVLVRDDGAVKVLDFGISKHTPLPSPSPSSATADTVAASATASGMIVGTPGYMAPEQLQGGPLDGRTNQFAWGVLAYELLSGRSPWGRADEPLVLLTAILTQPPASLAALEPRAPAELVAAITRALSKDPAQRFPSMLAAVRAATGERATPPTEIAQSPPSDEQAPSAASTPITSLPDPLSDRAEAVEAHREALRAFRDGRWTAAHEALERAVALDPKMAAAHLRLALTSQVNASCPQSVCQARFQKAVSLRDRLTPRDRAMLRALEPVLARDPADIRESLARMRAFCEKYSGDGELHALAGYFANLVGDLDDAEHYARRAIVIDPENGDAWQCEAEVQVQRGDLERALETLERGLDQSPTAADLYFTLTMIHAALGHHDRAEAAARRAMSWRTYWYAAVWRASALFAMGRPLAAVRDVLLRGLALEPPDIRGILIPNAEAALAALTGDFARPNGSPRRPRTRTPTRSTATRWRKPASSWCACPWRRDSSNEQAPQRSDTCIAATRCAGPRGPSTIPRRSWPQPRSRRASRRRRRRSAGATRGWTSGGPRRRAGSCGPPRTRRSARCSDRGAARTPKRRSFRCPGPRASDPSCARRSSSRTRA